MSLSNENNAFSIPFVLGDINADATFVCMRTARKMKITAVYLSDGTGIAKDDTDYVVAALKNGSTVIADYSTKLTGGDGALVADTLVAVPIESGQDTQAAGSTLSIVVDVAGSGAMDEAFLQIDGYYL
jgi:hypothetical protein